MFRSRKRPAAPDPEPRTSWRTGAGDTAEVVPAQTAAGNPPRWFWRVVAPNGRIVASSGQTFTRRRSARRALARTFPPATRLGGQV